MSCGSCSASFTVVPQNSAKPSAESQCPQSLAGKCLHFSCSNTEPAHFGWHLNLSCHKNQLAESSSAFNQLRSLPGLMWIRAFISLIVNYVHSERPACMVNVFLNLHSAPHCWLHLLCYYCNWKWRKITCSAAAWLFLLSLVISPFEDLLINTPMR